MGLSPIKPRDGSEAEKERYERDIAARQEHPTAWGLDREDLPIKPTPKPEPPAKEPVKEIEVPAKAGLAVVEVEETEAAAPVPAPPAPVPELPKKRGRPKKK